MRIKLWPSGHSHDYSKVFFFKDRQEALRNDASVASILKRLQSVNSGGLLHPTRVGGAYIVFDELDYGNRTDRVIRQIEMEMSQLGAAILPYGFSLAIRIPRMEEVPLLNKEEIEFAKFAKSISLELRSGEKISTVDGSRFNIEQDKISLCGTGTDCSIDVEKLEALEVWFVFAGGRRMLISKMRESDVRE